MICHEFTEQCEARFNDGQCELREAMQALVAREDAEIYEALAHESSHGFLEPLLFTYFYNRAPALGLAQIAFGHVQRPLRPGALRVRSDDSGRVYLPNFGVALTAQPNAELTAMYDAEADALSLSAGAAPLAHQLLGTRVLADSALELLPQSNPLLDTTFTDTQGAALRDSPAGSSATHEAALLRALGHIARQEPVYYDLIRRAVRQVFVFECPNVNCFATLNAHGIVFFNAQPSDDEIFFIDELVHQCGHVIFNAISLRRPEFFLVDPDLPMAELAPQRCRGEARSLYTVMHGLYTETAMVQCLRALDEGAVFSGRKAHELRGRLAFITRKMEIDVANMDQKGLCSALGAGFLDVFRGTFVQVRRERDDLFHDDLSDQPYNFSYARYARRNPPPRPLADGE